MKKNQTQERNWELGQLWPIVSSSFSILDAKIGLTCENACSLFSSCGKTGQKKIIVPKQKQTKYLINWMWKKKKKKERKKEPRKEWQIQ